MPLRISLKAHERLIVGGAVVRNGDHRCDLLVENDVPILRGKEVLALDDANSPCRRIYFATQLAYVDPERREEHARLLRQLLDEVAEAAPSARALIEEVRQLVGEGAFYRALKTARKLIALEEELIGHAAHR
ncbi:MAG: flagellar biosynthesis repressor FlbT [Gemmatimonadales bacterium]